MEAFSDCGKSNLFFVCFQIPFESLFSVACLSIRSKILFLHGNEMTSLFSAWILGIGSRGLKNTLLYLL